jgi:predicted nucleic acid-binding protein
VKGDRVLIDTSVWIAYFKDRDSRFSDKVDELLNYAHICVPKVVIAELIQGAKSEKEIAVIKEFFEAFTVIDHTESTWEQAGRLSFSMKRKGITINLIDCYLAITAQENNCKLFSLDEHFSSIKNFTPLEII